MGLDKGNLIKALFKNPNLKKKGLSSFEKIKCTILLNKKSLQQFINSYLMSK